jgi:predicted nucleic acid-binding protein
MAIVIDASIALAWCLDDEQSELAAVSLDRVVAEGAVVPPIWPVELSNGLLSALRRQRVSAADVGTVRRLFAGLSIRIGTDTLEHCLGDVLSIARDHALTAFDASYLATAVQAKLDLATLDDALLRAAAKVGVSIVR